MHLQSTNPRSWPEKDRPKQKHCFRAAGLCNTMSFSGALVTCCSFFKHAGNVLQVDTAAPPGILRLPMQHCSTISCVAARAYIISQYNTQETPRQIEHKLHSEGTYFSNSTAFGFTLYISNITTTCLCTIQRIMDID